MDKTLQQIDHDYIANTYNRYPVEIVSGKGAIATDETGREYIDMGAGIGVTSFGYCDPVWQAAVTAQLGKVQHTSNLYYTEPGALLARELCRRTGLKKAFFGNSGAEANECAIKVARKYAAAKKGPDHSTILTLWNSFHGRTLTTLAATGQDHYHELFQPLTPGFQMVHAGDFDEFREACETRKVAGILLECIQGEGGVRDVPAGYLCAVASYCREHDLVLMVDEVQAGNGRTGKLYSYEHCGIEPDVVTTAKGLGGGLPIGACLLGDKVQHVLGAGDHGSTFGGNPVVYAGALSILRRLDDAFLAQVTAKGERMREGLTGAPGITAVTGKGLMVGLQTGKPADQVVQDCLAGGVLCLTAKDRVRLLPPLNIPDEVLDQALDVIRAACAG